MKSTVKRQQNHFASAVHADVPRSTFMRPSVLKTTFEAGRLVPVYVDEVLPGDTISINMRYVARTLTPIFPTMDSLNLDFYAFWCPNRLLWTNWEALCGENKTGAWTPTTPPATVPLASYPDPVVAGSIADYMGIPPGYVPDTDFAINALPFRAYGLIWNEWFRDENLQAPVTVSKGNSNSGLYIYRDPPFKVNKPHDYFTSCLPAPQKGQSQLIPIELNQLLPVLTQPDEVSYHGTIIDPLKWVNNNNMHGTLGIGNNGNTYIDESKPITGSIPTAPLNLWADGRGIQATSSTISDLRTAFQLQKLYERDARGGTRYREMLKSHFGVTVEDYRVQVPEFLGKFSSQIGTYQIAQTSSTDDVSPQGNVSAFAYGSGKSGLFKKSFVEHGYLMIFAVARQPKTYQQGIERFWFRKDRFDFYYPALAHISEQPVYNREIYAKNNAEDTEVFGYQEAWAEYRYKPSRVSGKMRSGVTGTLDSMHYADWYTDRPTLSATWIQDNSDTNLARTLAVTGSTEQIWLDIAFDCKATRPMPLYSIPGLIDHF